jgi:hypothetical protein
MQAGRNPAGRLVGDQQLQPAIADRVVGEEHVPGVRGPVRRVPGRRQHRQRQHAVEERRDGIEHRDGLPFVVEAT